MSGETTLDKLYIVAAQKADEQFGYGETITKEWLIENFALQKPTHGTQRDFDVFAFQYMTNVEGFKEEMLIEYKKYLVALRGKGYLIAQPKEQTDYAMVNLRQSVNSEIRKAIKTLNNVNTMLLSDSDIKKRDEAQGKIAAIAAFHRDKRLT